MFETWPHREPESRLGEMPQEALSAESREKAALLERFRESPIRNSFLALGLWAASLGGLRQLAESVDAALAEMLHAENAIGRVQGPHDERESERHSRETREYGKTDISDFTFQHQRFVLLKDSVGAFEGTYEVEVNKETVPSRDMEKEIQRFFPASWVSPERVGYIHFVPQPGPAAYTAYQQPEGWRTTAECYPRGNAPDSLVFYEESCRSKLKEFLGGTLAHELAHANDFRTGSVREGNELFLHINSRLSSDDRYCSPYVESIGEADTTYPDWIRKYVYRNERVSEYWAEICEQYFTDPAELPAEDFELVENWIRRTDPGFCFERARQAREFSEKGGGAAAHVEPKPTTP